MDIIIFYEFEERELTNACLLKFELERRGYTVEIVKVYEPRIPFLDKPKLIITPFLYMDSDVETFTSCFFPRVDKILNLQYEQIISKKWLDSDFHSPRDLAKKAVHVCWSDFLKNRLENKGIDEKNCIITGDIRTDFDRSIFKDFFKSKESLAKEFNLNNEKKWVLFISSFTLPNAPDYVIDNLSKKLSGDGSEFKNIMIESKRHIMDWVKKFLVKNNDKEFIYRPHPNEALFHDDELNKLSEEYPNFHLISKYSVQQWIINSNFINTWISTSIIDAFFMNKHCNILRPVKLDENYDSPLMINARHISTYEEFERVNTVNNEMFPIKPSLIKQYYDFTDKPAYKAICDYVDLIIDDPSYEQDFYSDNAQNMSSITLFQKCLTETTTEKIQSINKDKQRCYNTQLKLNKILDEELDIIPPENNEIEMKILHLILNLKRSHENELHNQRQDYENELNIQKDQYEHKLENQKQYIQKILFSNSWKWTKPIRKVGNVLRSLK